MDFAARSVISPDPYINMDEIGIPLVWTYIEGYGTYSEPSEWADALRVFKGVLYSEVSSLVRSGVSLVRSGVSVNYPSVQA